MHSFCKDICKKRIVIYYLEQVSWCGHLLPEGWSTAGGKSSCYQHMVETTKCTLLCTLWSLPYQTTQDQNIWWTDTASARMLGCGPLWCTVSMVTFVTVSLSVHWTIWMVKTEIHLANGTKTALAGFSNTKSQEYCQKKRTKFKVSIVFGPDST